VEYSLSPENVWPKACHESVDAYRYLIHTLGINPHKVILIGDSAGGNLVATTLLTLKNQRSDERLHDLPPLSLPAGAALLSPWVDLTPNLASFKVAQPHLDSLSSNQLAKYTSNYIPNYDYLDNESKQAMLQNPLISPLYGNFTGVCPLFIAYGDNEILKTSIEAFISNLKKDVHSIAIFKGVNANHVWLVDSLMASSKQVFEEDCKVLISWIALTSKTGC
jgi:acetyl esterase/lipase